MADDSQFVTRLLQEMTEWEREGLLAADAATVLRRRYEAATPRKPVETGQWIRWVLYLAVFAFLAAFFSFAGSSGAFAGAALRVAVLLLSSLGALGAGAFLHRRQRTEGRALLILGGMLLPIAFYYAVHHYALLPLQSPYLWWFVLGLVMAGLYTAVALALHDEGLGGVAVFSVAAAAFLLARHCGMERSLYPLLSAMLGLGCFVIERGLPGPLRPAFTQASWLLGHALAGTALLLPLILQRYGSYGAMAGYLLATGYFFLRVRLLSSTVSVAPLALSLMAAVGALVRAAGIGYDLLPLLQLAFSGTLIALGVLFLRRWEVALLTLLLTLFIVLLPGVFALMALRPEAFRGLWLYALSIGLYGVLGLALYVLARRLEIVRGVLALLGTWHLFAALILFLGGAHAHAKVEAYTLPLGGLLLVDLLFVSAAARAWLLTAAVGIAAGPSLFLSIADRGLLRTVLLCLGGIGLIAAGAFRHYGLALVLGIFVLLPAVFIKILPGLAELGIPRFVWFAIFGALLVTIALVMQRRSRPKTADSAATPPG